MWRRSLQVKFTARRRDRAGMLSRKVLLASAFGSTWIAGVGWGQTAPATEAPAAPVPAQSNAPAVTATEVQGGVVHGTVVAGVAGKPGGVPLPGVAVTATNTLTGRKYATATDADGAYTMRIPRNGRYVIRVEIAGFAPATAEVVLTTETAATAKVSDFGLQLASRVEAAEARATAATSAAGAGSGTTASLLRNLQGLNLNASGGGAEDASAAGGGNSGASMPSLAGLGDNGANSGADTVAISGANGQTNGLANFSEDDLRQRIQEGVQRAQASGMLPAGVDPTNVIAGILGPMMGAGGGPGGGGRGGGGRGGAGGRGAGGGAFRRMDPTQLHGGLNFQGDYSTFDSAQWSPTLTPQTKQPYARDTFGVTLAGSPQIPGLIKPSTKQFGFLNFNFSRNTTPVVLNATVPTAAERTGDLSGLLQKVNGQTVSPTIYDPTTGQPFAYNGVANVIDPARISPQALYVLNNFYPLPNVNMAGTQNYNYQTDTTSGQNSANLSMRFILNLGSASSQPFFGRGGGGGGGRGAPAQLHQSLKFNFSYSHSAQDVREFILPLSGATVSDGYNLGAGYTIGKGRWNETASLTWNRSNALTRNYFTNTENDPAGAAGITLPSTGQLGNEPNFYNGLPTFSINNFSTIGNPNPQQNVGQTVSFTDQVSWRHGKHNMRFGGDVRRSERNSIGGGNPLGRFTFTGFNTEDPCVNGVAANCPSTGGTTSGQENTGAAFADFLLGLPQQTQIQAGLEKIYLRGTVLDWYANDDYRPKGGLTINFGLRYEYFGPYTEIHNRLANLTGVSVGTTNVGCVTPAGVSATTGAGPLNCGVGPNASLIHPDKAMVSPRFGVAYQPKFLPSVTKSMVVRAGYGINFNTGQFATFAQQLSYQPPFAINQNNTIAVPNASSFTGCAAEMPGRASNLTLANGFGCSVGQLYQNSYAVDPNYRLGYVQIYNVDIQRTLPLQVVLNVGYNGSHGSDQNVVNAPNHTPTAITTTNATAFLYQQSIAESTFNAFTVNAQKRLQKGVQLAAKYQWAHSIDDASSINGTAETSSVQNPADLHAERSNSSFDVRQQLTGSWVLEPPFGPNRKYFTSGKASKLLDGFSLSGTYTIQSGGYFTPSYQATAEEVSAGGTYTLRPNLVAGTPIRGLGQVHSFFNTAAFTAPPTDAYGTAARYSIQGPGQVVISTSLSRTVPFGDTRSFEARVTANNVFNTVQYNGIDTSLTSATFGQVTGAQTMRQLLFVGRYRF